MRRAIRNLTLTDFRNYPALSLLFCGEHVVITGENGAGKTNLLEAVSFFSPGRGMRRAVLADVAREGSSNGFAINAGVEIDGDVVQLGTGTFGDLPGGEPTRRLRINGVAQKYTDALTDYLRVVWVTPQMDGLFTGSASDRRRFLDRLVLAIDPMHGQRSLDFERAMKSRNRLFEERRSDERWYDAIETQLAEYGAAIAAARVQLVRLLAGMMEQLPEDGPFPKADLSLQGSLEEQIISGMAACDVEDRYRDTLRTQRGRDMTAGRTVDGPHRSDLSVFHRPKNMAASQSSTGEQKALLIGIILSHARLVTQITGSAPILLLDEIAAHLDAGRRAALFGIIDDLGAQAFMTGTDRALFSALEGHAEFLSVSHGLVSKDQPDKMQVSA
jgi:DNA replication and repair protein RecF